MNQIDLTNRARPITWARDKAVAAGIDEFLIRRVVEAFYATVRNDPVLAPIFATRVHDWDAHITLLTDFWSGVLLTTGCYKGKPLVKHLTLQIGAPHFERWLALFGTTVDRICSAEGASIFRERASNIAKSLQMGIEHAQSTIVSEPGLPASAVMTKRSRSFTPETLPRALMEEHNTRAGVWGLIVVEAGSLSYTRPGNMVRVLHPTPTGDTRSHHVIYPEEPHTVQFCVPGSFFIQFYEVPESNDPEEHR